MFRLQDNVPDIYVNESRDFQLLCRLYDCVNNGVKSDIDTIVNLNNPFKVNEKLLNLLALKVGFITDKYIESSLMRWIISTFPWALKYKGSIYGIKLAVNTIAKYENITQSPIVTVDSMQKIITINTYQLFKNTTALDEYLKYIVPTGYTYEVSLIAGTHENLTITNPNEIVYFNTIPTALGLDLPNDAGYMKYAKFKITYKSSSKNITDSIVLTKGINTFNDGDYLGVGSILGSTNYIDKTIYYGDADFPSSIPAGSVVVNSYLNGVPYPTYSISVTVDIENGLKLDRVNVTTSAIKTEISYYITATDTYEEEKDDNNISKPSEQLIFEYEVPVLDVNKYNHTILTSQVSGLEDDKIYIIRSSGVNLNNIDPTIYTHIYNAVDNSWYKYSGSKWELINYLKEINYTNNK